MKKNLVYAKREGFEEKLTSLDLYLPKATEEKVRPVMVMIHGGGWRMGDKANRSFVNPKAHWFVGQGYVVVSVRPFLKIDCGY